jgi:hypothetical protein
MGNANGFNHDLFENWSVSDLRTFAAHTDVDRLVVRIRSQIHDRLAAILHAESTTLGTLRGGL